METKIISLITILAFNFSISFANTDVAFTETRPVEYNMAQLAPTSPVEADFNDIVPEALASSTIIKPVTPSEASFDDETYQESINEEQLLDTLKPSTPKEAGFEENS